MAAGGSGGERCWTRTDAPGTVRFDLRVPPGRRLGLTLWAASVFVAAALLVLMFLAALTAVFAAPSSAPLRELPVQVLVLAAAVGVVVLGYRLPGGWRLARWRVAGRETVLVQSVVVGGPVVGGGRLLARRTPCADGGDVELDLSRGAFVGVVGDVDRFLIRATRWRSGRWLRRDDVPGLDVGSVRISTPDAAAIVGLSLSIADAESLAAEMASLPGFTRDRSHVPRPSLPEPPRT